MDTLRRPFKKREKFISEGNLLRFVCAAIGHKREPGGPHDAATVCSRCGWGKIKPHMVPMLGICDEMNAKATSRQ
jgi:hypothetical protein